MSLLLSRPVVRVVPAPAVKSATPPPVRTMTHFDRQRLAAKVAAVTCSTAWADHVAAAAERQGVNPSVENIEPQLADRGIYPPRADLGRENLPRRRAVRMRRCDACRRLVPPNNMASLGLLRLCDDCRIEPESDLDKPSDARTPGVQPCTLVEGVVINDIDCDQARKKLRSFGLSDGEIFALALSHLGYSTRKVAAMGHWSQTYVLKLLGNAKQKLRRSGLSLPPRSTARLARTVRMSFIKLDNLTQRII